MSLSNLHIHRNLSCTASVVVSSSYSCTEFSARATCIHTAYKILVDPCTSFTLIYSSLKSGIVIFMHLSSPSLTQVLMRLLCWFKDIRLDTATYLLAIYVYSFPLYSNPKYQWHSKSKFRNFKSYTYQTKCTVLYNSRTSTNES